jgi:isochorismate hydrolase
MLVPELRDALINSNHENGPYSDPYQIAIVGIETHICVTQTALDLLAEGHRVYVLTDGVSSCHEGERSVALERLRTEGAIITTSESFLYECMGDANIPEWVFLLFVEGMLQKKS